MSYITSALLCIELVTQKLRKLPPSILSTSHSEYCVPIDVLKLKQPSIATWHPFILYE